MSPKISLIPEPIAHIGGFIVTNSFLTALIVTICLTILSLIATRHMRFVPRGLQNFFEMVVEAILGMVEQVLESKEKARQIFPLIATIFLFILFANWMGILPGVGSIGLYETHNGEQEFIPLFRSTNADLNMTVALALISIIAIQALGIFVLGLRTYLKRFFNFSSPTKLIIGQFELLGEFTKIISFSFRLFGNIFAGEVLLVVIGFLIPYIIPLPFLFLEIFVGFIQAFIFAVLTLVFYKVAITQEEAEEPKKESQSS
ncbi:MAG TPA: F0F1 ATP synthase subunit A [Patescibacteria group bacterium]|nr:F0F1 ATP synthase subunit A [Patescibacteria group bacterium]